MVAEHKICTFRIDDLLLGVRVGHVQEVLQTQFVTPIPLADARVAGLVNLRGQIVTAIDLRVCLNRPSSTTAEHPLSLIVQSETTTVSLLVDQMEDVLDVNENAFCPPPETLDPEIAAFVNGAYAIEGGLVLILGVDEVIGHVTMLHAETET